MPDSLVYTDSFQMYDVLEVSEFHHRRANHSKVFVTKRGHHRDGIEHFLSQAKRHMRRFNGIPKDNCFRKSVTGVSTVAAMPPFHQLEAWYRAAINRS